MLITCEHDERAQLSADLERLAAGHGLLEPEVLAEIQAVLAQPPQRRPAAPLAQIVPLPSPPVLKEELCLPCLLTRPSRGRSPRLLREDTGSRKASVSASPSTPSDSSPTCRTSATTHGCGSAASPTTARSPRPRWTRDAGPCAASTATPSGPTQVAQAWTASRTPRGCAGRPTSPRCSPRSRPSCAAHVCWRWAQGPRAGCTAIPSTG